MDSPQQTLCLVSQLHTATFLSWEHSLQLWEPQKEEEEGEEQVHPDQERRGEGLWWHKAEHIPQLAQVAQQWSKIVPVGKITVEFQNHKDSPMRRRYLYL
jgi:hypothetical protein